LDALTAASFWPDIKHTPNKRARAHLHLKTTRTKKPDRIGLFGNPTTQNPRPDHAKSVTRYPPFFSFV